MNAGRTHRVTPSRPRTAPRQGQKRCWEEDRKKRDRDRSESLGFVPEKY